MFGKEGSWPLAPFHPPLEDRQHTLCPDIGFDPLFLDLSGLFSPFEHSHRLNIPMSDPHVSTFLRPFAPQALPRFSATVDALTPARAALRSHTSGHEHRPNPWQVSLLHVSGLPDHSVPNHLMDPRCGFSTRPLNPSGHLLRLSGVGFAPPTQARRSTRPNRVRFCYGLVIHLLLLSTPLRSDAVTVDYRPERGCLKRTCTSRTQHARRRT